MKPRLGYVVSERAANILNSRRLVDWAGSEWDKLVGERCANDPKPLLQAITPAPPNVALGR